MSVIETIQKRVSIRTFTTQTVTNEVKAKMRDAFLECGPGPFGNKVRFEFVEATENEKQELKELGTYGIIKGSQLFIAGAVEQNQRAMEDFGYCMEKIILKATELGLGTCWLGGALNRSTFAKKINAAENELIPAITPLGYPADKRSMTDSLVRAFVGSKKRKSFEELFFYGDLKTPLEKSACGPYAIPLECVRLAPSAANKQPWRVIQEKDQLSFHFYLKENPFYNQNKLLKDIHIQNLDIGIALCHFELAAKELSLKGVWQVRASACANSPQLEATDWQYIVSWTGSN